MIVISSLGNYINYQFVNFVCIYMLTDINNNNITIARFMQRLLNYIANCITFNHVK